eukprot:355085-Rhodomonas_salina.3
MHIHVSQRPLLQPRVAAHNLAEQPIHLAEEVSQLRVDKPVQLPLYRRLPLDRDVQDLEKDLIDALVDEEPAAAVTPAG